MQISIIIIRQQHLLILVILKTKCLFFSNSCQWIRFNIKHWASLSLFKLRMYSCTLIDRFIHKKRFSHNIVFFFLKKKEDSEVWGDLRTPRPLSWGSSASSSRSSANTAPGSRTSRWPGPGNWWTGRGSRKWWWWYWKKRVGLGGGGGRKGEVFQCQEFANTMAQGRAVDTARCNFLLRVFFVCARASLTHSYGQIEDNLWMSHIKKK